jgi:hypothetical protein
MGGVVGEQLTADVVLLLPVPMNQPASLSL